jgi:type I restriction enzyme S subunit
MSEWKPVSTFVNFSIKGITPKYIENSTIIVLNQKCIRNNRIDYSFSQFTDSSIQIRENKFVKRGDILVNSTGTGTAGRCAFVAELPKSQRLIVDSHILILRCHNYYEAQCLSYILFSFEKTLMSFMTGSSGQSELDKVVLLNLLTRMPTEPAILQKIAAVFTALDAKIELNNRINAELESMAKTLYDYWFVQFDFPDKNGKPYKTNGGKMVLNAELKREVPAGWEVGELSDIANITMGQSPPGESYNEDREGMIFFQGCTDFGNRFPTIRQHTTQPTRFAKEGDILLSVRAPVGALNIAKVNCCIGRGLAALNSKDSCNTFLFGTMINFKQIFDRRNIDGTTFGSITKDDLFSLKVVRPSKEILKQYQETINPAFEKQNKIELENQQLAELRDWLLPMLMNGQVKVN